MVDPGHALVTLIVMTTNVSRNTSRPPTAYSPTAEALSDRVWRLYIYWCQSNDLDPAAHGMQTRFCEAVDLKTSNWSYLLKGTRANLKQETLRALRRVWDDVTWITLGGKDGPPIRGIVPPRPAGKSGARMTAIHPEIEHAIAKRHADETVRRECYRHAASEFGADRDEQYWLTFIDLCRSQS